MWVYNDFGRELSAVIKRNKRFCLYAVILKPRKLRFKCYFLLYSITPPIDSLPVFVCLISLGFASFANFPDQPKWQNSAWDMQREWKRQNQKKKTQKKKNLLSHQCALVPAAWPVFPGSWSFLSSCQSGNGAARGTRVRTQGVSGRPAEISCTHAGTQDGSLHFSYFERTIH